MVIDGFIHLAFGHHVPLAAHGSAPFSPHVDHAVDRLPKIAERPPGNEQPNTSKRSSEIGSQGRRRRTELAAQLRVSLLGGTCQAGALKQVDVGRALDRAVALSGILGFAEPSAAKSVTATMRPCDDNTWSRIAKW